MSFDQTINYHLEDLGFKKWDRIICHHNSMVVMEETTPGVEVAIDSVRIAVVTPSRLATSRMPFVREFLGLP